MLCLYCGLIFLQNKMMMFWLFWKMYNLKHTLWSHKKYNVTRTTCVCPSSNVVALLCGEIGLSCKKGTFCIYNIVRLLAANFPRGDVLPRQLIVMTTSPTIHLASASDSVLFFTGIYRDGWMDGVRYCTVYLKSLHFGVRVCIWEESTRLVYDYLSFISFHLWLRSAGFCWESCRCRTSCWEDPGRF